MFKKKKTTQSSENSPLKAGILKRAERRFFKFFNYESGETQLLSVVMLVAVPSIGISYALQKNPSNQAAPDGAAHVQRHMIEAFRIARDSRAFAMTPEGVVVHGNPLELAKLDRRIGFLADQLVLDHKISEQDAQNVASYLMQEINKNTVDPDMRDKLISLIDNAALLEETRQDLPYGSRSFESAKGQAPISAAEILSQANNHQHSRFLLSQVISMMLLTFLIGPRLPPLLKTGSRRNNRLQQEQTREIYSQHMAQLRDMLKPKTSVASNDTPSREHPVIKRPNP